MLRPAWEPKSRTTLLPLYYHITCNVQLAPSTEMTAINFVYLLDPPSSSLAWSIRFCIYLNPPRQLRILDAHTGVTLAVAPVCCLEQRRQGYRKRCKTVFFSLKNNITDFRCKECRLHFRVQANLLIFLGFCRELSEDAPPRCRHVGRPFRSCCEPRLYLHPPRPSLHWFRKANAEFHLVIVPFAC